MPRVWPLQVTYAYCYRKQNGSKWHKMESNLQMWCRPWQIMLRNWLYYSNALNCFGYVSKKFIMLLWLYKFISTISTVCPYQLWLVNVIDWGSHCSCLGAHSCDSGGLAPGANTLYVALVSYYLSYTACGYKCPIFCTNCTIDCQLFSYYAKICFYPWTSLLCSKLCQHT